MIAVQNDSATRAGSTMQRGLRLLRTVRHLQVLQVTARARSVVRRRAYSILSARPIEWARRDTAGVEAAMPLPRLPLPVVAPEGMDAVRARARAVARHRFCYIGSEMLFPNGVEWSPRRSPLWVFNLHYLGSVLDAALADDREGASRLLASWSGEYGERWDEIAWHPYTTSLRLANLCLAAGQLGAFSRLGPRALELVATHAAYLLKHLEWDLRGNHLLENARALLLASRYLRGRLADRCDATARSVFTREIPEQVLPDGAHFELSPMYHCIVMHRLLEAATLLGLEDRLVQSCLGPTVVRMAEFLRGILCPDGGIPLLGDSVRGFAPPPGLLLNLADRIGSGTSVHVGDLLSFPHAGLHVLRRGSVWTIFDAGPVCPSYLPGHGQADSLTVEAWLSGTCVVGDPGVHDYTGPERVWGRSSRAHSTITVDDRDTSEMYGSFRVGGRARITHVISRAESITATLRPFGDRAELTRTVALAGSEGNGLRIEDRARVGPGRKVCSRLHLHPAVRVRARISPDGTSLLLGTPAGPVNVQGLHPISLEGGRVSRMFGKIEPTSILMQELRPEAGKEAQTRAASFLLQVPSGKH